MAQGHSTTIISMIQWNRTSRLSISLSVAAAEMSHRGAPRVQGPISSFYRFPLHHLPMGDLTSRAQVKLDPARTATAVLPAPRSTEVRFTPISARREQE